MWRYQGHRTLAYYLKRRDCLTALSEELGVETSAVVATVMKQLLENIAVSTSRKAQQMGPHYNAASCR